MMRSVATLVILVAGGCGDGGSDGLAESDARAVFAHSNDLVHSLHNQAFAMASWPAMHTFACPGGGQITMTSVFGAAAFPEGLLHVFDGCTIDGFTLDGQFDYTAVTICSDMSFTYTIVADLDVAGRGGCVSQAQETCGVITGSACGVTL